MATSEPNEVFRDLADEAWLQTIIATLNERTQKGVQLPGFPPDEIQRNFVGSAGEHTLREGYNFYRVVKKYAAQRGMPIGPDTRILDFGCGWGRMARFFLKDVRARNVCGLEVDPDMVNLCRSLFPHGRFESCAPRPPTREAKGSFDVIYAYSVFSHLNETVATAWIEEFARLLKRPRAWRNQGGLLLVTTQGRAFIDFCASLRAKGANESLWHKALANSFTDRDAALRDYDAGKFLHAPTGGGEFREASFYGESIIPRAFVEKHWTKHFELVDFIDDPSFLPQALIVLQRR